jgi:hypothetical protein
MQTNNIPQNTKIFIIYNLFKQIAINEGIHEIDNLTFKVFFSFFFLLLVNRKEGKNFFFSCVYITRLKTEIKKPFNGTNVPNYYAFYQ